MNLRDMQERRAVLVTEMRALTAAPAGSGGDLSAEQSAKFDQLKSELEGVERNIERQRVLDEAERRMQGQSITGSGDNRLDDAMREFSLRRAICMQVPDLAAQVDCGREREISAELARRAGRPFNGIAAPMAIFHQPIEKRVVTGAGEGSNLIATDQYGNQFIDALRARMVVRRLGARVLSGLVGNVDIPKLASSASTGWVADNAALTPADPDFSKVQMSPKHAGGITEFSRSTLLQSSPDIEMLLRDDFAKVLANRVDITSINGGGSNEPSGVLQSGLNTSVTMGALPSWANVLSIVEKVELGNGDGSAWVTTPSVVRLLRSTPKTGDDSVMIMDGPSNLAGYPLAATNNCPGDSIGSPTVPHRLIFGNWSDLLIGFWSELDVLVNPYESTAYSKGNVQVRAMMTLDIAVRHSASFAACVDVLP